MLSLTIFAIAINVFFVIALFQLYKDVQTSPSIRIGFGIITIFLGVMANSTMYDSYNQIRIKEQLKDLPDPMDVYLDFEEFLIDHPEAKPCEDTETCGDI